MFDVPVQPGPGYDQAETFRAGLGCPVRRLVKLHRRPLDFPLHVWGARIDPEAEEALPESRRRFIASGIGLSSGDARAAAFGEGLERYTFWTTNETLSRRPAEPLPDWVTEDTLFDLPFLLPPEMDRRRWARAARRAKARCLPARRTDGEGRGSRVEMPVEIELDGEHFSLFQTTNGLACGIGFEDAAARALREVIERDALMLVWLYRTSGAPLSGDTVLPSALRRMSAMMAARGVNIVLRDISTEFGYCVVLAIAVARVNGEPLYAFGAGASSSPGAAASHAFTEACLSWKAATWRSAFHDFGVDHEPEREETPRSFAEHADFYRGAEGYEQVRFLLGDSAEEGGAEAPEAQYGSDTAGGGIDAPPALGKRPTYALDLTPSDVAQSGGCVVKVVVPGLLPLTLGDQGCVELARARLPAKIGGRCLEPGLPINTAPHPWP